MAHSNLARRVANEWPLLVVLVTVALGMVLVAQDSIVGGSLVMGLALLTAAGLRLFLTNRAAGLLVVRRRAVDVALYGALGCALVLLGVLVQGAFS